MLILIAPAACIGKPCCRQLLQLVMCLTVCEFDLSAVALQAARKIHTGKFRAGKVHLMIVTDVAARGIDIPLLDNVINFDFPAKPKLFVHRVGRAARAGRLGTAYSLLTRDELPYLIDLHLFLSRPLIPAPVRSLQQAAGAAPVLDPSTSVYGTFPQVPVKLSADFVSDGDIMRIPLMHALIRQQLT